MTENSIKHWKKIEDLPDNLLVIGYNKDSKTSITGEKYDLRPDCIIDLSRGRWMKCTHWAFIPTD